MGPVLRGNLPPDFRAAIPPSLKPKAAMFPAFGTVDETPNGDACGEAKELGAAKGLDAVKGLAGV
jgi:hypothetical protein